jgi:predicted lipid-binding transport protein (Tim44 family)
MRLRTLAQLAAIVAALALVAGDADAAPRFNAGSRGSRTFIAPPPTATAPNAAGPIERSMTQPGRPAVSSPVRPATSGGFFNRTGLLGGLAAGLLGAGLFGLLFGYGFLGGLGGLASFLGLLLQIGIIVMVARLIWRWWQRNTQTAAAFAGGPTLRDLSPYQPRANFGSIRGSATFASAEPIEIKSADFDAFERSLGEIQTAYGAEDLAALRLRMTPEMLSYYSEELAKNASRGVVNRVSDVKLLQGDLAEAWREGNDEYATVTMRYSLIDRTLDRASGHLVEGSDRTQETTELWTFRRVSDGKWLLSAIQQT